MCGRWHQSLPPHAGLLHQGTRESPCMQWLRCRLLRWVWKKLGVYSYKFIELLTHTNLPRLGSAFQPCYCTYRFRWQHCIRSGVQILNSCCNSLSIYSYMYCINFSTGQAGSLTLLTLLTCLGHSLRFASPSPSAVQNLVRVVRNYSTKIVRESKK